LLGSVRNLAQNVTGGRQSQGGGYSAGGSTGGGNSGTSGFTGTNESNASGGLDNTDVVRDKGDG
jgi:hypothetical protein